MGLMAETTRTVGMVAGSGIYPEIFARAARARGVRLVATAFKGETSGELVSMVDEISWMRVGQVGKMLKFFVGAGVTEAVMVGQVAPSNLFDLRPDFRAIGILARLKERNAESLFGGVAAEMEKDGITLLSAVTFLEDQLPQPGPVCGPKLDAAAVTDAAYGFRIAKETSRLDIGQTVLVRDGTVLAVEAFEGTNSCIRRGGELGRGKRVKLIKVSKPNQDMRFDVPVVGPDTIRICAEAGVTSIVVEAGCTLVLGREEVEELCHRHKVALHAMDELGAGLSPPRR